MGVQFFLETFPMKQQLEKMVEIPQEPDFITWNIQNFVRKVFKNIIFLD